MCKGQPSVTPTAAASADAAADADEDANEDVWTLDAWLNTLNLHQALLTPLAPPEGIGPFEYACGLSEEQIYKDLQDHDILRGIARHVANGAAALRNNRATTAFALNAKFVQSREAEVQAVYGNLDVFFRG